MTSHVTSARAGEAEGLLFDPWFDPIEDGPRAKVRGFIEAMIEETVLPSADTAAMLFWATARLGPDPDEKGRRLALARQAAC